MTQVYLSLGSNQGDRLALLSGAVDALRRRPDVKELRTSSVYETDPVGYTDQPPFLNCVAGLATELAPHALLAVCQAIEAEHGRVRTVRWGPRTLDIDIIAYGELVLDTPELILPHPRAAERAFVLVPLVELDPGARLAGRTAEELLAALGPGQGVRLYAPPLA